MALAIGPTDDNNNNNPHVDF